MRTRIWGLIWTFLYPILWSIPGEPPIFVFGLLFLHIVGVIPLIFLLAPHIAYISYYIPQYSILWPIYIPISPYSSTLLFTTYFTMRVIPESPMMLTYVNTYWGPLVLILNGDVLTILALVGTTYKLIEKLIWASTKRLRIKLGDITALILLLAILITGFLAAHHIPPGIRAYREMLGLHVLFAEIWLIILPYTKFFHFVFNFWFGKLHEWFDNTLKRGLA